MANQNSCDENDDDIQQFLLHTTRMVSKKLGGFGNHFYVCEQSYCHIFGVKGSWVMHSYHLLSFDKIDVKKGYERGNVLVVLEAAKKKWNKHLAPCQQAHFDFMPFAVDVCGLIDWAAVSLLKRIACKYSEITLKSYAECVSIVRRRISFAIQSGVARQLSRAVLLYC